MTMAPLGARTLVTSALLLSAALLLGTDFRGDLWGGLLGFFQWLETTPVALASKTWGAVFALVEAVHLMGLALLGGALAVGDGRLAGLWLTTYPGSRLQAQVHRLVTTALITMVVTGVFMACAVAVKIYYLEVFWYKMLTLLAGTLFYYGIRQPWVRGDLQDSAPWMSRLVALASVLTWGTVAACGRWIGFSG